MIYKKGWKERRKGGRREGGKEERTTKRGRGRRAGWRQGILK